MDGAKFRWGVLGCAKIAVEHVIPEMQRSERCEVSAIASRDRQKAEQAAETLGIAKTYGSYEQLLADEDIDAVYIPLPNHLHKEWTIRAAEAGKHVLCEKPIGLTAAEAKEMADACAKANVMLAEAFMYRHHPRYDRLLDIVRSGKIGTVRGIHATFTYNGAGNSGNIRFNKEMGGGALYDIGVYPISAARMILGQEPEAATVHAQFSEQHDGVDMMASGLLEFPGGVALTFDCGMWSAFRNTLEVVGSEGRIVVPSAFRYADEPESANFFVEIGEEREEIQVPFVGQYLLQADDFANSVLHGAPMRYEPSDAVLNMRVVDACLQSARTRTRVLL